MPRIITIAREYGSGGRLIAQKVAQKVGLVYYDNEVIDLAAREMGMDVDAIRKVAEQKSSSFMYTMQSKIIRHLANHDSCIIVNGCADYILEDYDDVLSIFIHAPLESRIRRVKEDYQEVHDDYKKYVTKRDKVRSNYYNYYTTKKWGHLKNFDLTINSDLGIDEVATIIADLFLKGEK